MGTTSAATAGRGGRGTASRAAKCADHEGQQNQREPEDSGSGLCDHLSLLSPSSWWPAAGRERRRRLRCAKPPRQYIIYEVIWRASTPTYTRHPWECQAVARLAQDRER